MGLSKLYNFHKILIKQKCKNCFINGFTYNILKLQINHRSIGFKVRRRSLLATKNLNYFVRTFKRKRKKYILHRDTFVDTVVELFVDECVELVFVETFVDFNLKFYMTFFHQDVQNFSYLRRFCVKRHYHKIETNYKVMIKDAASAHYVNDKGSLTYLSRN